jgi:SAM-dependent methyltransferase
MNDRSNGYERVAAEFLAGRGSARGRSKAIGVKAVREWARTLPRGTSIIDIGCGPGFPLTEVLVAEGLKVNAVDASPSFVEVFRGNLPKIPVACEAVEDSAFFRRTFDAAIAVGLIFLLPAEKQRRLIRRHFGAWRAAAIYVACRRRAIGMARCDDRIGIAIAGAVEYRSQLAAAGLSAIGEYEDEGANHYFDALKSAPADSRRE